MKAIAIVDMPSACDECKFETEMLNCGKPMCCATPYRRERIEDDSTKPLWCPLRPLPEKDEEPEDDMEDYIHADYDRMASYFYGLINGRNSVINEILGEYDAVD